MNSITTKDYSIHFNTSCYTHLNAHLKNTSYSKIFILVDTNTHNLCLPNFLTHLETTLTIEIIEIEVGEIHKTIDTCSGVWSALSDLDADRKSLLINVGGGVVTDLGGFVASTFKRGISYIHVPTTLLAMVDASVGGKTGVDLGVIKNQIGVINTGEMVLIDTTFLNTLPENQIRSGLAEMLKHGLIHDENYWNKMNDINFPDYNTLDLDELIYESVIIKKNIVAQDPFEKNLRKALNYGHTLGHAIESYFLSMPNKTDLLHGEAVAIGMVLATYISTKITNFPVETCTSIKIKLMALFGKVMFNDTDYQPIIDLLKFDKKNENGNVNFVLLEAFGKPKTNCIVDNSIILDAFKFYNT